MHACGHDGHMAGLLAAARILNDTKDQLSGIKFISRVQNMSCPILINSNAYQSFVIILGVVKLIFQPAEEGYGGAKVCLILLSHHMFF